ncbi:MAG: 30S ribosomal protein S7 [Abditibacteriales bacterium]|nr:30S ribosomal protein S7 [Abditibacteriales bacterium]MDW8365654.1 30S ribosomal protein S7 [Abditibacteriales bacterium]
MPRKGPAPRRRLEGDPVFGSVMAQRFINCLMRKGKKSVAEKIFYGALQRIAERTHRNPLEVLAQAIRNVTPLVEVRSRRVGGATYQVPTEVRAERKISLSIRWILQYARERSERGMIEKLANEILDASRNTGNAIKKKEETHRMAEANKAFAHYRW